jgi:hypothetical protein
MARRRYSPLRQQEFNSRANEPARTDVAAREQRSRNALHLGLQVVSSLRQELLPGQNPGPKEDVEVAVRLFEQVLQACRATVAVLYCRAPAGDGSRAQHPIPLALDRHHHMNT